MSRSQNAPAYVCIAMAKAYMALRAHGPSGCAPRACKRDLKPETDRFFFPPYWGFSDSAIFEVKAGTVKTVKWLGDIAALASLNLVLKPPTSHT